MSILGDSIAGLDPLFNRAQMLGYPLFVSAYIAEFGLGSIFGGTTPPLLGYTCRVLEATIVLTVLYTSIQLLHRWMASSKAFGGYLQLKGVISIFLMPYGFLGLVGSYFNARQFGDPSLWHVVALAFGFILLQEQRLSRTKTESS